MASRIRVAAVGLGWVALNRHLPVMDRSPHFEVVGVIDRQQGRAEAVAKQRGYRRSSCAATLDEISWLDEVDAVTVATAPMAHHALVCEALLRSKHVLTEKPFAMTVAQGENMVQTRHPKIAIWKSEPAAQPSVQKMIDELEPFQHCTIREQVLFALKTFVPEMKPWEADATGETRNTKQETRNVAGEG